MLVLPYRYTWDSKYVLILHCNNAHTYTKCNIKVNKLVLKTKILYLKGGGHGKFFLSLLCKYLGWMV